jgi:hypothetical protein
MFPSPSKLPLLQQHLGWVTLHTRKTYYNSFSQKIYPNRQVFAWAVYYRVIGSKALTQVDHIDTTSFREKKIV